MVRPDTRVFLVGEPAPGIGTDFSLRATTVLTPERSGAHVLTLVELGHARLLVDGEVVLEEAEGLPRGAEAFGMASIEREVPIDLTAGTPVELVVEYTSRDALFLYLVKVGLRPAPTGREIDDAAAIAADADVAVVLVGTSDEWESEGHDRSSMDLPGDQDEVVRRVAAANPRTVVLVNAGAPVTMPWADDVAAVVQVWLGGQEMASAVDDVLFGDAEPAGRLPTTIPLRLEHNPTHGTFPGENDHHRYGEGLFVGYRWYDTPERCRCGSRSATVAATRPSTGGRPTLSAGRAAGGWHRLRLRSPSRTPGTGAGPRSCSATCARRRVASPGRPVSWPDGRSCGSSRVRRRRPPSSSTSGRSPTGIPTSPDEDELAARVAGAPMAVRAEPLHSQPGWWIDAGTHEVEIGASVADIRQRLSVTTEARRVGP